MTKGTDVIFFLVIFTFINLASETNTGFGMSEIFCKVFFYISNMLNFLMLNKEIVLQGVYSRISKELTSLPKMLFLRNLPLFFLNFFPTFLFTFETLLRHLIYLSSNPTLSTSLTSFNIQTSSTPSHGRYLFPATSLTIQILMKETKHIVIRRVGLLGTI